MTKRERPDVAPPVSPMIGSVVHVRAPGATYCDAGIVLRQGGRETRIRVLRPGLSPLHIGQNDMEGDYRHASDPLTVPTPDGRTYLLDTWHAWYDCPAIRYADPLAES